jgi:hypothetical protein
MLSALLVVKDNLVFSMYEGVLRLEVLRTASSNSIGSATGNFPKTRLEFLPSFMIFNQTSLIIPRTECSNRNKARAFRATEIGLDCGPPTDRISARPPKERICRVGLLGVCLAFALFSRSSKHAMCHVRQPSPRPLLALLGTHDAITEPLHATLPSSNPSGFLF